MAKIGQKWSHKDVNYIKNFCFLHHTSPKSSLEYGSDRFLAQISAQKNLPHILGPEIVKIDQNGTLKDVKDIKNFCFLHHTSRKSSLE
jgi:hypothetical protein